MRIIKNENRQVVPCLYFNERLLKGTNSIYVVTKDFSDIENSPKIYGKGPFIYTVNNNPVKIEEVDKNNGLFEVITFQGHGYSDWKKLANELCEYNRINLNLDLIVSQGEELLEKLVEITNKFEKFDRSHIKSLLELTNFLN